jgi:hypothetical protein
VLGERELYQLQTTLLKLLRGAGRQQLEQEVAGATTASGATTATPSSPRAAP